MAATFQDRLDLLWTPAFSFYKTTSSKSRFPLIFQPCWALTSFPRPKFRWRKNLTSFFSKKTHRRNWKEKTKLLCLYSALGEINNSYLIINVENEKRESRCPRFQSPFCDKFKWRVRQIFLNKKINTKKLPALVPLMPALEGDDKDVGTGTGPGEMRVGREDLQPWRIGWTVQQVEKLVNTNPYLH